MEHTKRRHDPLTAARKEKNIFLCALIGGGAGLAATLAAAFLSPLIIMGTEDPNSLSSVAASMCMIIGGAVGALIAALGCKQMPFNAGMLSAAVIAVPLIIASLFFPGGADIFGALIMLALLSASAAAVSFAVAKIALNRKKDIKRMMRRR